MSTNSTRPRRRTARAWARLVEAWKKSGKSAEDFAASRGLAARTLTWWKWRLATKPLPTAAAPLRLLPLQIDPSSSRLSVPPPEATPAWEIVTSRGDVLRVHRAIGEVELAAVLTAFERAERRQ